MKKLKLLFLSLMIVLIFFSYSHAASFTFYGTDDGGEGSAEMNIIIQDTTLTLRLDNTSSPLLIDSTAANTSGITKFGFNLENFNVVSLLNWELKAYKLDSAGISDSTVIIGGNPNNGYNKWNMLVDQKTNGVVLDYMTSDIRGVDGAIYNPLVLLGNNNLPGGSNLSFFTTSILTMNFNGDPVLDELSTYVRMQNVGRNGAGSLKMDGNPVPDPVVPEPATMLLLGSLASGLFGFAGLKKRFTK